jgi:protein involved in polysaccharide export with SLBB domain
MVVVAMSGVQRGRQWIARGLLAACLAGCSTFGIQSPTSTRSNNQLTKTAKEFREEAPVPASVPRELNKTLLPTYVVEPGDVLLVQPVDLDSPLRLPGDQTILLDGTIDLGKYGRPIVAGKTLAQIEGDLKIWIQNQTKDASAVTVRLVNRVSKVYYVLGEVNAPGAFPVTGRETVLDALIAAGGLNSRASQNKIILSRPSKPCDCRFLLPVCYRNIVQLGDTSTNYQIQPGDRVFVPGRGLMEELFFLCEKDPVCNCGDHRLCPIAKEDCCAHPGNGVVEGPAQLPPPKSAPPAESKPSGQ